MPFGPVIMSQDRLFKSFKREIIEKKPDVFKTQILREIKNLFPTKNKIPLFGGFGNRETVKIFNWIQGYNSLRKCLSAKG